MESVTTLLKGQQGGSNIRVERIDVRAVANAEDAFQEPRSSWVKWRP